MILATTALGPQVGHLPSPSGEIKASVLRPTGPVAVCKPIFSTLLLWGGAGA